MMQIKTTEFDANRHVLQGRDGEDGRERFFTIGSIVAAERPLEAQHEAVAIDELRAEIAELRASASMPENILALIRENSAPADLTHETMTILTDMTKAHVQNVKRLSDLEQKVDLLASTLVKISERIAV